jgi:hypothetical protein
VPVIIGFAIAFIFAEVVNRRGQRLEPTVIVIAGTRE